MGPLPRERFGGKPELRLFVKAEADVVDAVLSKAHGGGKASIGVRELVHNAYDGVFDVAVLREEPATCTLLLEELEQVEEGAVASALIEERPDVVVLGVSSDLDTDPHEFSRTMEAVVRILKERVDCHVLIQNCSSVDPSDATINYHGIDDPLSLRIHRRNLRLVELSMLEGISIVDADRVIAELGAAKHVARALDYSAEACEAIGREIVRVLADYGFFEERPLIPQLGRRGVTA